MDLTLQPLDSRIGRQLKLRDLHIFFAVVQSGSMAKAARMLGISQPAVSKNIADLESALRVRLLDRNSRGIEPTPYAHVLLKRGTVVFDELRQSLRDIEFLQDPTVGTLRIVCPESFASQLVPAAIDRLTRRHPQIHLWVNPARASTLEFSELRGRTVDLALARMPRSFMADDLDIEIVAQDRHFVVVGAHNPWTRRRKVALTDLVNEPWIFTRNQAVSMLVAEAFNAHGLKMPQERVTSGSFLLQRHLLATGRFLTVLPDSLLRCNAKLWSLKALPVDLRVEPRYIAIVKLKHRTVSPVVDLFVDQLRAVARAMFTPEKQTGHARINATTR